MKTVLLSLLLIGLVLGSISFRTHPEQRISPWNLDCRITLHDSLFANRFDFPVGKPDAKGYYNAQGFGKNYHLGDDWNAVTGGDSDLGDTIFTVANGVVTEAYDYFGGWGNVVRVAHYLENGDAVESLYAHCDTFLVHEGTWIMRGTPIGTIGNAHGIYPAHLHFELRSEIGLPLGGGYSIETNGYLNPKAFIEAHR